MSYDTDILCSKLTAAKQPEDVFGAIGGTGLPDQLLALKHVFNALVLCIHPDHNPGLADAGAHVAKLTALRKAAEKALQEGTYGKKRAPVVTATLRSKAALYNLTALSHVGEICDLYASKFNGKACLVKLVRAPQDNDLLDNEARMLLELHRQTGEQAKVFQKYIPRLLDSFTMIRDTKHYRVNVVRAAEGYVSLAQIREAFPNGIDPRDAAWMIRRAFEGLGWIHKLGYVHGAALPEHILVHPEKHGARIVDWSYAVKTGQRLTAVSAQHKTLYPSGVFRRQPALPALDVQLIAIVAQLLLSRFDAPVDIKKFFTRCTAGLVQDGWTAYKEFDKILEKNYGKRAYRPFAMPKET